MAPASSADASDYRLAVDDSVAAPAAENTVTLEIRFHHQEFGKMATLTAEGLCTAICLDPRHFPTNYVPLKRFSPDHKHAIEAFEKTNTELRRDPGGEQYLLTIKMLSVWFVD